MYVPKMLMADLIAIVDNGEVVECHRVPWLNEERADICVVFKSRRHVGGHRLAGIKVIGTSSPWGGFAAMEKFAAKHIDVLEVHMLHDIIERYGRF